MSAMGRLLPLATGRHPPITKPLTILHKLTDLLTTMNGPPIAAAKADQGQADMLS
jgi:hypothetical protein